MKNKKTEEIRLNRFIAMCGLCSRRKAEDLITKGQISVNNNKITSLSYKVQVPNDIVCFKGRKISPEKKQYILLNKPKGYITTTNDERGRKTVISLIHGACDERIVPVGRLDKDTTGLLLFTNDGLLAKKLMHPKHAIPKIYHVTLYKPLKQEDFRKIKKGIVLEDGFVKVDQIATLDSSFLTIKIQIHIGKNRIVRRIFEFLDYDVKKLDRVSYAGLEKNSIAVGRWRSLTRQELKILKKDS